MAQPDFVPVSPRDKVRAGDPLPAPDRWTATRPGELVGLRPPPGRSRGNTGPDQGYGLKLAKRFVDRLELQPGEHAEDAIAGCLGVGLRRASSFGRAPVIYDFEFAYNLFGFLGGAPADLLEFRLPYFLAASHDYWDQRDIADLVREETLPLSPAEVRSRLGEWQSLLVPVVDGPVG
jgi:hypothetical protein